MTRTTSIAALFVALLGVTAPLKAQTSVVDSGSFAGRVLDPLGAGVPDVAVQLDEITRNPRQPARPNNRHTTRTDSAGYFELQDLPTGTYRVSGDPLRPADVTITSGERVERTLDVPMFSVQMSATVCAECTDPTLGLNWAVRDMNEDHYRKGQVIPALLVRPEQFTVTYPAAVRAAGVEGTVEIEGWVGTDGSLTRLQVLSDTDPDLNDAVITALNHSSWVPARVRSVPVDGPIRVQIDFILRPPAMP